MSACDLGVSHSRKARKIKSDEPAPGRMFCGRTPRTFAMVSTRPSQAVGGDVRRSQGKYSVNAASTFGDGGNQASRTSALIISALRANESNLLPTASKNAPP